MMAVKSGGRSARTNVAPHFMDSHRFHGLFSSCILTPKIQWLCFSLNKQLRVCALGQ